MNEEYILKQLEEGINDPGIFKAVFTAGGPGSGKSTVAQKLGLFALGLRPINSDTAFTAALKKEGHTLKLDNLDPQIIDTLRVKAKKLTSKQMEIALKGRLGLVIDSTARNIDKIASQKAALEKIGYETAMLFVDTTIDTALDRNDSRERSVPKEIVKKSHAEIRLNSKKLKRLFGKDMIVIPNDGTMNDLEKNTTKVFPKVTRWISKVPNNKFARQWISQFKRKVESEMDINEYQRINRKQKMTDKVSSGMKNYEKKLFQKMLKDPKKARMELEIAIKMFRNQIKNALPATKHIIQAQLDKFIQLSDMLDSPVTEEELFEKIKINWNLPNLKALKKDPKKSRAEIDNIINGLQLNRSKFTGAVADVMKKELEMWTRMRDALAENIEESFSDKQLDVLRKEYSKIKKVDPDGADIKKIKKFIKNMDKDNLKALADAKPPVPWLSMLARFQMNEENFEMWSNSMMAMRLNEDAAATGTVQADVPTGPDSIGIKPDATFSKNPVFDCDNDTFSKCIKGKKKYSRWSTYLGQDNPFYQKMQDWMSQSYKNKNFVLRNKMTGEMVFARRMTEETNNVEEGTGTTKEKWLVYNTKTKEWIGRKTWSNRVRAGAAMKKMNNKDLNVASQLHYFDNIQEKNSEEIDEAKYPTWRVNFKGGPAPIVVARNTAEAVKKAEKIAKKQKANHALQLTGKGVEKIAEKGAIPVT